MRWRPVPPNNRHNRRRGFLRGGRRAWLRGTRTSASSTTAKPSPKAPSRRATSHRRCSRSLKFSRKRNPSFPSSARRSCCACAPASSVAPSKSTSSSPSSTSRQSASSPARTPPPGQNLFQILGIAGVAGLLGLLPLIKRARGRRPVPVTIQHTERVRIGFEGDDPIEVDRRVWQLFNKMSVRKAIEQVIAPLFKQGIDTFKIRHRGKETIKVAQDEAKY